MGSQTRGCEWCVLPVCGVCGAARRDCGTADMLWCAACRGAAEGTGLAVCAECAVVDDGSYTGEARAYCPRCFNVPRSPLQHLHKCIKCFLCPICGAPAFVHAAPVAAAAPGAPPLCRIRAMCVRCQWTSAVAATAASQQKAFIAFCQQALNAEHHAVLGDRHFAALVDLLARCAPADDATTSSSSDGDGDGNGSSSTLAGPEDVAAAVAGAQEHTEASAQASSSSSSSGTKSAFKGVPLSVLLPRRRSQVPAPSLAELDRRLAARAERLRSRNAEPIPAPAVKSPPQPFADGKVPYGLLPSLPPHLLSISLASLHPCKLTAFPFTSQWLQ